MKVVIIGAGFGGINLAKELAGKKDFEVILIDKKNYHLFQPFLYQVATAGLSPADISIPTRSLFRRNKNVEVLMAQVDSIEPKSKQVHLDNGANVSYDRLVVAAGAKNLIFNPDWIPHVQTLKSVKEALNLRKQILCSFERAEIEKDPERKKSLLTFVIIGAGPTGVELAGAISELAKFTLAQDFRIINPKDARIILIEAGKNVLSTFDKKLSIKAKDTLEKIGVSVWLDTKVTNISEGKVELGGDTIVTDTIIWAAGVTSVGLSQKLANTLSIETKKGGKLPVDEYLKVTGTSDIYAIGDICEIENDWLPGIAPVAIQQGKYLGKTLISEVKGKNLKGFKYKDKGQMATIGRRRAIAEAGFLKMSGFIAWHMWVFIHIYFLIGFRNRVAVFLQWLWSYVAYKKGARIIN